MSLISMAMLVEARSGAPAEILWNGLLANMVRAVAGNIVGGSVFVGVVFHVIYRHPAVAK